MNERKRIIIPDRFWVIWLSCLEKPRSLKEISKEIGYKVLSALYQRYQNKPLVDWMIEHDFLEPVGKRGKEILYQSKIEQFVPEDELEFWRKNWLKESIFKLENIKLLYKVEEYREELIRKLGHDFIPLIFTLLIHTWFKIWARKQKKKDKKFSAFTATLDTSLRVSYPLLNVKEFCLKVEPTINKHTKEIIKFYLKEIKE